MQVHQFLFITLFAASLCCSDAHGQQIKHEFGTTAKCRVDSNTITLFLSSRVEKEGLTFIINTDGKLCSSGKNSHPNDFIYMLNQLDEMQSRATISNNTYERIKCSLEKDNRIKEYMRFNQSAIDEDVVMQILNDTSCN